MVPIVVLVVLFTVVFAFFFIRMFLGYLRYEREEAMQRNYGVLSGSQTGRLVLVAVLFCLVILAGIVTVGNIWHKSTALESRNVQVEGSCAKNGAGQVKMAGSQEMDGSEGYE